MYGRKLLISTSYHPYRNTMTHEHDWQATCDDYEAGDPIGHGPTEADAVYALWTEIEFKEAEQAIAHALEEDL